MAWQYREIPRMRFLLPGLVILMWFVSMAAAQPVRGDVPQDLMPQPPHPEKIVRLPERPAAVGQPTLKLSMDVVPEPTASRRWRTTPQPSLPAASAFALQTNLGKYLDNWPTPGTTVARDEPPEGELPDEDLM